MFGTDPDRPGAGVQVVEDAGGGGSPGGGDAGPVGRSQRCAVLPVETAVPNDRADRADPGRPQTTVPEGSMVAGQRYVLECRYVDDGSRAYLGTFDYQPGVSGPDPEALARQVYEEVPLVVPTPHTSPPMDAEQLVGFPIWLWVDGTVWREFDASASLGGVTVTVVAQPQSLRWDMGDGTILRCAGPGRAWTPGTPDGERSDCSHVYQYVSDRQAGGLYRVSVTVSWSVTWSASTGQSGTLPVATRTSTFSLDVGERQAVITYGDA